MKILSEVPVCHSHGKVEFCLNGYFGQIQDGGMKWHELLGLRTVRKLFTRICRIRGSSYFAKQTPGYCLVQVCLFLATPENSEQEGSCRGREATGERKWFVL